VLLHRVQAAGLTRRRYGYYAVKATVLLVALAAVCLAVVAVGDHWSQPALAAALGICWRH
jgi:hypothetical protein